MTKAWLGPAERWPRHPKAYFRDALDDAKSAGWSLQPHEGHAWASVSCHPGVDDNCEMQILQSGRGGESVAKTLKARVKKCPHGTESPDTREARIKRASSCVETAERLIDAAERCSEADILAAQSSELFAAAEENADQAEQLLEEAVEADVAAAAIRGEARELAGAAPDTLELAHRAQDSADDGDGDLDGLRRTAEVRELRDRISSVRRRVRALIGRT